MILAACRPLAVWAGVTLTTVLLVRWTLDGLVLAGRFDVVLAGVAGLALAACAGWAWLVTTVVVAQALRGRARAVPGVPAWAARAVLAACGVAVLAAAPAHASGDVSDPVPSARVLAGLPYPDRPTGPARPPGAGPGDALAAPGDDRRGAVVEVRDGDSLWSIAAARLGPRADVGAVAAETAELYALNRTTIGPDPDLVRPGQRLRTGAGDAQGGLR